MMLLKLALVFLTLTGIVLVGAGCGDDGDSPDCSLERVLDEAQAPGTVDCGSLALSDSDTAFEAARTCISGAIDGKLPFRAIWEIEGIDSELGGAYLGRFNGDELDVVTYHYDSDVSGVGNAAPKSFGTQCVTFAPASEPCGSLREDLCFVCQRGEIVQRCP